MVGPQSAGAAPGPACYGRGGVEPTVTDANLVLNRLSAGSPLAGRIGLDQALAHAAVQRLGSRIGLETEALASGIVRIAVGRMVSAIKQISIANGYDPRDFTLLPYGGAGPMHAAAIADELEMTRVLIPVGPGNFAAFGSLISDLRRDYARTATTPSVEAGAAVIETLFRDIETQARDDLLAEGVEPARIVLKPFGRHALCRPVLGTRRRTAVPSRPPSKPCRPPSPRSMTAASVTAGVAPWRSSPTASPPWAAWTNRNCRPGPPAVRPAKPLLEARDVWFDGGFRSTPILDRARLRAGETITGPAVLEESGSTTLVPPGWSLRVLRYGDLLMEKVRMNPITLEVICESLIAIVREMRATIIRASYSSVIYEFDDFSCALFGPDGELVAQSWDHPGHVLPLPWGVRCALEDFAGDIQPGDAILLNDPYRGGTHLNDVTLLCPLFDDAGNMLIFPAVRAHWVDVGGMVPGSYSGLSTNVYQEGVRIPPIKIIERGTFNRSAMTLLMANMRVPEEREGDLRASLGACNIAERRIRTLLAKYGWDTVREAVKINLDRSERRLRQRIAALPDGDYHAEDYLEFYNAGKLDPVLARLKLTVAGDHLTADFAGTNPQVPGVVNCSLAVAGAGVFVAVKATLDPGGAVNEGAFRPITLKAPEASIFNVRADAPAGAHGEVRKRGVSLTMAALAQIIPDKVSGDLCGSSFPNSIGGWNERRGRQYVLLRIARGRQRRLCRRRWSQRLRQYRLRQPAVGAQRRIDRKRNAAVDRGLHPARGRRRRGPDAWRRWHDTPRPPAGRGSELLGPERPGGDPALWGAGRRERRAVPSVRANRPRNRHLRHARQGNRAPDPERRYRGHAVIRRRRLRRSAGPPAAGRPAGCGNRLRIPRTRPRRLRRRPD